MRDWDEELAIAIATHVSKRAFGKPLHALLVEAARMAMEGWSPANPKTQRAREICARIYPGQAQAYLSGSLDDRRVMQAVIAGIEEGGI